MAKLEEILYVFIFFKDKRSISIWYWNSLMNISIEMTY